MYVCMYVYIYIYIYIHTYIHTHTHMHALATLLYVFSLLKANVCICACIRAHVQQTELATPFDSLFLMHVSQTAHVGICKYLQVHMQICTTLTDDVPLRTLSPTHAPQPIPSMRIVLPPRPIRTPACMHVYFYVYKHHMRTSCTWIALLPRSIPISACMHVYYIECLHA
jgi:hypothetical protein